MSYNIQPYKGQTQQEAVKMHLFQSTLSVLLHHRCYWSTTITA